VTSNYLSLHWQNAVLEIIPSLVEMIETEQGTVWV
jgi:hypothetical protein